MGIYECQERAKLLGFRLQVSRILVTAGVEKLNYTAAKGVSV